MQGSVMQQQHLLQRNGIFSTLQVRRIMVRAGAARPRLIPSTTRQQMVATTKQPAITQQQAVDECQPAPSSRCEGTNTRWAMPSWLAGGPGTTLLGVAAAGAAGVLGSGFQADGPIATAQAIGVLATIIAVHEFGHFSAARLQGIHVTQFAIGFGPPLISYKPGEVEYSLRAIPLGGYVAFPEDDPKGGNSAYASDDPDLLQNRNVAQRAVVISAGVVANVLFALAVLFAQVNIVGKAQTSYLPGALVPALTAGGIAEQAGFQRGDIILRVGDVTVAANPGQVPDVVSAIKTHPNEPLAFEVQRGKETLQLQTVPAAGKGGEGVIGITLGPHTFIKHTMPQGLGDAVTMTTAEFNRLAGTVLNGLVQVATNFNNSSNQLAGPIAIVAAGSEIARTDAAGLYQFCAIININLAIVNTLPLPALDGGYLLLLLLEAARGKKLPDSFEQGVMTSGLLLMLVLGVTLVIKDTISLL
ncbi:intramembrane metalloprotease [Scenedesmus sp. NREL 46B-D3]|nr:intramembrane metalloprotease [Scenedesmus sp. NREL 46B-D3]